MIGSINEKKFLLKQLVKRDLTSKYKDSFLGVLWSFINPLLIMLIFTAIFASLFRFQIKNFPVYFLIGRIVYEFFMSGTSSAMRSIRSNASILKKIFVPRYMFSISSVCYEFINFLISLVILFGVMFITGADFPPTIILSIIPMILLIFMVIGIGLILAVLNTYFTDVGYLYSIFALVLMYASAVFYPMQIVPANIQVIFSLNPLYVAIECFRSTLMYGIFPDFLTMLYFAVFSFMIFGVGFLLFRIHEKKLVLEL